MRRRVAVTRREVGLPEDDEEAPLTTTSEDESQAESLFIVECKLNDAIKYIEKEELYALENFLYDFKNKYNYLSDRIQIKWRLLMAHCKENRK